MFRAFSAALLGLGAASIAFVSFAQSGGSIGQDPGLRDNAEPVLVELFTSQGCSSCPPADKLAARLVSQPHLVVVSRPVTYWDRLGWKDTLALAANTDLQRRYAWGELEGRNGVYTPQMVIDGSRGAVGSREQHVRTLINQSSQQQAAAIRNKRLADGSYQIGLGGEANAPAELVLMALTSRAEVSIGRGENSGRTIAYTNVLKREHKVANWNGGKQALVIPPSELRVAGADRYALVLRELDSGRVLAAQYLAD